MNVERDKFLWKLMVESGIPSTHWKAYEYHINMRPWEYFGKLWNWAQTQDWFREFEMLHMQPITKSLIQPDQFANTLYEYLKGNS